MKVLYTPFSIIAGLIGTRIGRRAYAAAWQKISDSPPPRPTEPDAPIALAAAGAALEAATVAAGVAATRVVAARAFHHLFGLWPGKKAKPTEQTEA